MMTNPYAPADGDVFCIGSIVITSLNAYDSNINLRNFSKFLKSYFPLCQFILIAKIFRKL